jgi:flagellar operon protein
MDDGLRVQQGSSVQSAQTDLTASQKGNNAVGDTSFSDVLLQAQNVRFSNHAQKRLESRQINLDADSVSRLSDAVDRVENRGSQSSLVLMDDMAFVVNVPQRLVVTAIDTNKAGAGVFTQIDSVVLAEPSHQDNKPSLDIKA